MPEILTKHPDVTKQILEKAGGKCGPGQEQKILKACPEAQFCSMPGGELCVFGVEQVGSMSQIEVKDLQAHVCTQRGGTSCAWTTPGALDPLLGIVSFAAAAAILIIRRT